jgi:hypothetical protein
MSVSRLLNRRAAPARVLLLTRTVEGTAELLADGVTLWASDTDPDLLDVLGTDAILDADLGDVLDYLVEHNFMTDDEADDCVVDSPEDDDGDGPDDEDEDEDEDEDDPEGDV